MFEEIEKTKQHSALFTILGVFVLLATIVGVAVAAYTWNYTSENANVIGTGNISMSFLESSDVISISDALPTLDSTGMAYGTDKSFDFAVTTSASGAPGNITYSLSLEKLAATSGYTALSNDQIKLYLTTLTDTDEIQVMAPTLASKILGASGTTGTIPFDSGKTSYLTHAHTSTGVSKTTKYRLRMWIDYGVDASSWTTATKLEYKLKVNVSGSLVG